MQFRGFGLVVTVGTALISSAAAMAQTAAAPAAPSVMTPGTPTPRVKAGVAKSVAAHGRACTRLPLSDIQVGKEKTIEIARIRLGEYIAKVGNQRGWKSWDKSQETVSCDEFLFVPFLGQEYKCLVTATFCQKS